MEYAIGALLGLGVCGLVTVVGFERDRAAYPIMLIVIASYYWLFGVLGGDMAALAIEIAVSLAFVAAAIVGFRTNLWIVVVGLIGHAALDAVHGHVVANPGVPEWWPVFCGSIDAVAGIYLAWRLLAKRIDASDRLSFANQIRSHVDHELARAAPAERAGDAAAGFRHLERAHVLGQASTVQHVRAHWAMLIWALRHRAPREVRGQITRLIGAATKTWIGLIPSGNTGGANVSAFKAMPIPGDLADIIAAARSERG
ncbi:MAG: DUF3703 domain-containing protein [Hyphomonadaceae bacterium]